MRVVHKIGLGKNIMRIFEHYSDMRIARESKFTRVLNYWDKNGSFHIFVRYGGAYSFRGVYCATPADESHLWILLKEI